MKELSVTDWESEIDRGLRYRREYGVEDSWATNEDMFYHRHNSNLVAGPNLIASIGDSVLSQLSVPTPYIEIKPRRGEYVDAAPVLEAVDNHLINDLDMPPRVEESCLHAFLFGVGIWKIGYDSMWGWDGALDIGGRMTQAGATLSQITPKGQRIEFGPARPGMPWVETVMPHDFVVPWGTKDIDSAPWAAHRTVRHVDDVKADPKYSNKRNLQPTMSMEDWVKSYQSVVKPYRMGDNYATRTGESETVEYVEVWEIRDARTHQVITIATGHPKFLRKDTDALAMQGGLPFVSLSFTPKSRTLWVTPTAYYLRAVQAERTDINKQNNKQRRISVAKFLVDQDAFDPEELVKLTSADVGGVVKVKSGLELDRVFRPLPIANNQNLWMEADRVDRDAQATVGLSNNQQGEFDSSSRRTATEAAVVNQNAGLRMGRLSNAVKRLYTNAFRKINPICFQFWQLMQQVQYVGADGVKQWARFNGDGLRGQYAYDVSFSDDGGESLAGRKQMAMTVLQNIGAPFIDPAGAVKYAARAFNDPDLMQVFNQQFLNGVPNAQGPQGLVPAPPMPGQSSVVPPTARLGGGGARAPQMGAGQGGQVPGGVPIPHIGARGGQQAVGSGV